MTPQILRCPECGYEIETTRRPPHAICPQCAVAGRIVERRIVSTRPPPPPERSEPPEREAPELRAGWVWDCEVNGHVFSRGRCVHCPAPTPADPADGRGVGVVVAGALAFALLSCIPRCAQAAEPWHWRGPNGLDVTLHVAAEALLLADMLQTFDLKNHPSYRESNLVLGEHPTDAGALAYFAGTALATTALWYAMPQEARWMVDGALFYVELPIVISNRARWGLRFSLPF